MDSDCNFVFESATGKGLASITLPAEAAKLLCNTHGFIEIEGPGFGASAFTELDFKSHTLKRVIVTSPGCGYDETTKVYLVAPNRKTRYACSYTLAENTPGPLVKRGSPTLNLYYPNTHTGGTVVESGMLRNNTESVKVFPTNTPYTVQQGATLSLGTKENLVASALAGTGRITRGATVTVTGRLKVTTADVFGGRFLSVDAPVTFADDAVLEITDPENLADYKSRGFATALAAAGGLTGTPKVAFAEDEPVGVWKAFVRGNTLVFGPVIATTLILR